MKTPEIFDAIRPFEPEELPLVFERLLADQQFRQVIAYLYPGVSIEAVGAKMRQCKTNLDFQKAFCYTFLENLLAKADGRKVIENLQKYPMAEFSMHRDGHLDPEEAAKELKMAGEALPTR